MIFELLQYHKMAQRWDTTYQNDYYMVSFCSKCAPLIREQLSEAVIMARKMGSCSTTPCGFHLDKESGYVMPGVMKYKYDSNNLPIAYRFTNESRRKLLAALIVSSHPDYNQQ